MGIPGRYRNRILRCTRTAATKRNFGGYYAISAGWLLHTAWDVLHHVWELPIVRWIPTFFDRVCRHRYPIGTVDATWCPRDL